MGNIVSFQCSGVEVLDRIIGCLCDKGYIRTLKENLRALEREMEDLRAIKDEVQNKVVREETRHKQKRKAVQVWLTRVESIDTEFNNVLSASPVQLQKLFFCGLCSKNVCSSYNYGKTVFLLLEEVRKLNSEGNFEEVVEPAPTSEMVERPTQPTIGQDRMLEKAWKRLMEDNVGIMGLHGMGGVGKTTLFKKIYNKFSEIAGTFNVVIWIVVSQGATISKLQEDIADKLHLCSDEWKNKSESDKAADIYDDLKRKRFALMLDDIWEEVDLEAIGVPFPTEENKCKVAFTTRSQEVCGRMGDHDAMEIKCLERDEAWELFKSKVGDNTLSRDPGIVKLARRVADKCRGLPLALKVIGKAMSSKTTVREWEHAMDVLTRSAAEFSSDMENKILSILKFSYDSLGDEQIQSCFLYCALFPEDELIDVDDLIHLWICEGFLGEYQVIKEVYNKGYAMLRTLLRANLLTESGTESVVMHDVLREMALWIASDFGKQKENFVVQANVGLVEIPQVKDWGAVRRMSLMKNKIKEITCSSSKCSQLTTLFLQKNQLKNQSGEFIRSMKKLVVLDLSKNSNLSELPEQISELDSLQYLDLSYTSIEKLPVGLQELKKLTHLILHATRKLRSISGISRLVSLRVLSLFGSSVHGDVSVLMELQLLEKLQVLMITVSEELSLEHILLGDQIKRLANCITYLEIIDFQEKPLDLSSLPSMENLNELIVVSSHVVEIYTDIKCRESETDSSHERNPKIPCFTNLCNVRIGNCHSIKDLTWLLFAPNLTVLYIEDLREVEEVINKEKATDLTGITPFQKLQILDVDDLPKLESIYRSPLPFPFLRRISVWVCPKLRKFPLNATSAPRLEEFEIYTERKDPVHENDLEWEDEDTKNRFLPSIRGLLRKKV
ncbi:PREDICTED: probable disease resistance protein At1g61190 isoform X1 [Camelina sativa]|uniref:Probable disease resistance protein At1g61190 isoform X1 n=1 Tax=Camelina sativa TaxID=90675 RepID=A0ABM1QA43_CAMSA|nr:PREDICTED: probable disease resistance protein At1g61190 isoform X1 [Camelina sativa]